MRPAPSATGAHAAAATAIVDEQPTAAAAALPDSNQKKEYDRRTATAAGVPAPASGRGSGNGGAPQKAKTVALPGPPRATDRPPVPGADWAAPTVVTRGARPHERHAAAPGQGTQRQLSLDVSALYQFELPDAARPRPQVGQFHWGGPVSLGCVAGGLARGVKCMRRRRQSPARSRASNHPLVCHGCYSLQAEERGVTVAHRPAAAAPKPKSLTRPRSVSMENSVDAPTTKAQQLMGLGPSGSEVRGGHVIEQPAVVSKRGPKN